MLLFSFLSIYLFCEKIRNKIYLGFILLVVPRFFSINVAFDGGVGIGLRSAICSTLGDCGLG
jgi:hypothetical protein